VPRHGRAAGERAGGVARRQARRMVGVPTEAAQARARDGCAVRRDIIDCRTVAAGNAVWPTTPRIQDFLRTAPSVSLFRAPVRWAPL